jgi:CRISPR-associated endoribonuclease Cas6
MTTSPDLLSFVLALRPLPAADAAAPPAWWGRAAHALLLKTVHQVDEALAEALHEESGTRPFTVSNLLGRLNQGALDPSRQYFLRFTSFQPALSGILLAAAQQGSLAPGQQLELDYLPFQVEAAFLSPPQGDKDALPAWAGLAGYAEISAALLLSQQTPPRRLSLQFASPTTFKSGGMHVPLPLPSLVFGSLLDRWNAYAPIAFPEEARRYAAECLAVGRYALSSRAIPVKSGGLRMGGVGTVTYHSLNYDRYWMSVIGVLAAFAQYSGAGAGTTAGLGQCRQIVSD